MQNLLEELKNTFQSDERLIVDGKLAKNKIVELVLAMDTGLIGLLLKNESIKKHFFRDINGILVFDKVEFQSFVSNKQFLPDSYTAFKNKIGLTANGEYLTESKEVVLVWPYKDCVLEGGQTKDDQKRKEIFWSETLAPNEIDRLLAPKVLTNFTKYDKNGEHGVENISLNDNLIIKGNNLIALRSLKKKYAGKVKLIYIDPPYNTGNDSFQYNDSFNHSTWLTFMKNRLEVAKELLRDDGVIFVQCDDNEQAYLKVLMDSVFGRANFTNTISVKMNESKGLKNAHIEKKLPKNKEYIHVFSKNKFLFNPQKVSKENYELKGYVKYYNKVIENLSDDICKWRVKSFVKCNDLETKMKYKNKLVYFVKPDNNIKIKLEKNKFGKILNNRNKQNVYYSDGNNILKVLFLSENIAKFLGDLWTHISTININKEGGVKTLTNGQKPEELIEKIISLSTKSNDIVLDYHIGSGTTAAVAHKMNRRFIACEQMNYIENITIERLKKVIAGEQGGISKSVNWQGGGNFIYCELAKHNANIIDKIEKANTTKDLKAIWHKIENTDFISYKVNPETVNENIHEFEKLSIDEQKQFLIAVLDKNQLYVNYSEIDDEYYQISDSDKKLNKQFYGEL